jgi:hypothetical protein
MRNTYFAPVIVTGPSTITNLSNSLRRTYSDRFFKAFQSDFNPILDELDEAPDEPTRGVGWFFPFYFNTPQNWRVNGEGGDQGTTRQRSEEQGQVNAVEFLGWIQISEMLKNAGTRDAAWNGGELNRHMKETTTDITHGMQRMFTISHGTGRLAVVENDVTSGNTFKAKLDEGVVALMEGDVVDFVDLDTGGTVQVSARTITAINRQTRIVTFSGAAAALTANWGVYKTGDYGRGVNGFHGLIDNAAFTDDVHGKSRASFPKLNAQVRDPGTPTELTEDHMRQICDDIAHVGGSVDRISCNTGVMNAFFDIETGNRRYSVEKGNTAKFHLGYKEGDALFSYDKGDIVIRKNLNMPARTMYFYSLKSSFHKHTLRKLGWIDEGGSILRLTNASSGQGFATIWTALICAQVNLSCYAPLWNGARRNIKDAGLAGDS